MITTYNLNWLKEKFEAGQNLQYLFFWGHSNKNQATVGKFCLSQWFQTPFSVNDLNYSTAEHWMMAHKALIFKDKNTFDKIIQAQSPNQAKKLGREISNYNDEIWNEKKFHVVTLGNIHKFNQHPKFAAYLLATENKILVEASPLDTIWGIGRSENSPNIENIYTWRGQNLLGFALMATRDFLKTFGHFKPLDQAVLPASIKSPHIDTKDMFWQTQQGKEDLNQFTNYYQQLSDREKTIYKLNHPQAYDWAELY